MVALDAKSVEDREIEEEEESESEVEQEDSDSGGDGDSVGDESGADEVDQDMEEAVEQKEVTKVNYNIDDMGYLLFRTILSQFLWFKGALTLVFQP